MTKRNSWALAAFLLSLPCSSFSEPFTYGSTSNAASFGLNWSMANVLPNAAGLTVGTVIYGYDVTKDASDDALIHVSNEDAMGAGYIFRETDDWSGLPSNSIRKGIPVGDIPIQRWGDGSIEVDGQATVSNASVIYTYKIDECFDPQLNPACPGYEEPKDYSVDVDVTAYNALEDDAVRIAQQETDRDLLEDEAEQEAEDDEEAEDKKRLERALAAATNALAFSAGVAQEQVLAAMQNAAMIAQYQRPTIQGGVYPDAPALNGGRIPDSRRGLRNGLAQQLLHEEMVASQYK